MDESALHMAKAMVNMSVREEELYAAAVVTSATKSDKTAVGKIRMQDKLQSFRYDTRTCRLTDDYTFVLARRD